jgi:hypothetical protein
MVVLMLPGLGLLLGAAWHYRGVFTFQPSALDPQAAGNGPAEGGPNTPLVYRIVKTNVVETNAFRWSQLESEDYRAYVQRLRDIGCPEQTIRDILIADIDKLFAPRVQAINPLAREVHYWEPDGRELESLADYRERQRQQREVDFTKRQALQDLLGVDLVSERNRVQGAEDRFGRRLGALPEEKRGQVRMVLEQFSDEETGIRQKSWEEGVPLSEEDQALLKELEQEREEAVAKLLTPAEYEQYQLALSPLAYKVRDQLFGMNATEQEYRAVYQLRQAYEAKWPDGAAPADPQQRADWEEATAALQAQIREKLGDARYAEYQRAQDPDFRELSVAAARYQVPARVAAEVYEYKAVVLEQRARVAGNRSFTPEQQQAALAAMAVETEQTVKNALGEQAYKAYLRSGQGAWLQAKPAP